MQLPRSTLPRTFTAVEGRRFAWSVGTAFLLLAVVALWRQRFTIGGLFLGSGLLLILAGTIVPARLGALHHGWMQMAAALSRFTSPIVLGVLWYIAITPFALLLRVFGRRSIGPRNTPGSTWVPRPTGSRRSDLRRQF